MAKAIDNSQCVACGVCVHSCPFDAIHFDNVYLPKYAEIDQEKCVECDYCVPLCPVDIIVHDENTPDRRRFTKIEIIPEKCIGCSLCKKVCPANAISGVIKQPFVIDQDRCIQCGVCASKCKKDAFQIDYID